MQRSLVYNAIKPCSRCKETLFATQTNLHRIHLLPIHKFATETITNHSSHPICKDTTFHHPFASFPPTFSAHHHASDALRVYFGCTSITKYTRRTTSQLHHTQPKTASRHPKGVLVYFLFKKFYRTAIKRKIESVGTPLKDWDINIYRGVLTDYNEAFIISTEKRDEILANASRMTNASVLRSLYDPIKAFLYILSSMDDNFASIISFINDKLGSFYPTRIYTESCRIRNRTANIISQITVCCIFFLLTPTRLCLKT